MADQPTTHDLRRSERQAVQYRQHAAVALDAHTTGGMELLKVLRAEAQGAQDELVGLDPKGDQQKILAQQAKAHYLDQLLRQLEDSLTIAQKGLYARAKPGGR